MLELMYKHEGLGLAAPQVALPIQLLVMNFAGDPEQKESEFVAINPVIVESEGHGERPRGLPELPRPVPEHPPGEDGEGAGYNLKGELYEMTCHDLPARVWQHEIDHLDGVLFIDKMGSLGLIAQPEGPGEVHRRLREGQEEGRPPAGPGSEAVKMSHR